MIEDNVGHARFMRTLLEQLPFRVEVHQAGRVTTGIERLDAEPFDIIVSDLHLPDVQGASVVTRILARHRSIPLVTVTALDDDSLVNDVLQRGAADCVRKDRLTVELLTHVLHRAVVRVAGTGPTPPTMMLDEGGLYNREGLTVAARRVVAFARRHHHPVTVVHLVLEGADADIDKFVRLAVAVVRDADIVGRLTPERVCLVLPDDRSDPPAVLGRLEAKRLGAALDDLVVHPEVRRFDPEDPVDVDVLLNTVETEEERSADQAPPQRRALVATTDPTVVEDVATALGTEWRVIPSTSAVQAVRVVVLEEPTVIVVDFALPEPGAIALVRQLSEQPESVSVPVIAIDRGHSSEGTVTYRDGLSALLPRDRLIADLARTVDWTLRD